MFQITTTFTYHVVDAPSCPTTLTLDTFGEVLRRPDSRLAWLHQYYRGHVVHFISQVASGLLGPEDLQDAYQDTVLGFFIYLDGHSLPSEEYVSVLQAIGRRRAIDALRRRGYQPITNADVPDAQADSILAQSEPMGPAERQEFDQALESILANLPEKQQLVARLVVEHHEEFGPRDMYQRLTDLVSARTCRPERLETVKSLWHAARRTIRAGLIRRGYSPEDMQDHERSALVRAFSQKEAEAPIEERDRR